MKGLKSSSLNDNCQMTSGSIKPGIDILSQSFEKIGKKYQKLVANSFPPFSSSLAKEQQEHQDKQLLHLTQQEREDAINDMLGAGIGEIFNVKENLEEKTKKQSQTRDDGTEIID